MTREVFVVKMRREEERWGRGKDFCSGAIELYFEPSGKLVKKYIYRDLYQLRYRVKKIIESYDYNHCVHIIPDTEITTIKELELTSYGK